MNERWWPPSNAERLFNLSMLLDGIALHDHLYTLKAELPPDATGLQLRQLLIEKDIVREMETAPYLPKIKREFSNFFGKQIGDRIISNQIEQALDAFLGNSTGNSAFGDRDRILLEGLRQEYEGTLSHWWFDGDERLFSQPFLALGEHLLESVSYFGSGTIVSGVSYLRTFIYWRISEHANIPLYPSSSRIPQLDAFASHIRLFTAEKIYQVVAQAFKENIHLVYEDEAFIPLCLPPSLSIFFELYRSSHDLSKAIDDFRKEFAGVRQDIYSFEEKLKKAKTLQDRIEIKHNMKDVLSSMKTYYQLNNDLHLETILGFAPEILNPLTNPTDPSKYSDKLLTMPVSWVKDWWKKRSFRHVFDLRKRLHKIAEYEQLASSILNIDFGRTDNHDFYEFDDKYQSLYRKD